MQERPSARDLRRTKPRQNADRPRTEARRRASGSGTSAEDRFASGSESEAAGPRRHAGSRERRRSANGPQVYRDAADEGRASRGRRQPSGRDAFVGASLGLPHSARERQLRREARSKRFVLQALPLVAILAVLALGFSFWSAHRPINVSINDAKVQLKDDRSLDAAVKMSGVELKPGNLVDVEGELLEEGGGAAYTASIGGKLVEDPTRELKDGDHVEVGDGMDLEEESSIDENAVLPSKTVVKGSGPIHVKKPGKDGLATIKTGSVSGKQVVEEVKQEPSDTTYLSYRPDVGSDKVVALTFDDGPVPEQTNELLDVLAQNGATATFFVIGQQSTGSGADDLLREERDGHQVATHTYDHAAGSGQGVNLGYMSAEEQRDEITKGISSITQVLGHEVSPVLRAPGGNFGVEEVWVNVEDLVSAEIGWNIDTRDWSRPGVDYIVSQIESAQPGDVILMHDGGGDRSQTIEALKTALPYLKEQGFRFITIDELLQYPALEDDSPAEEL